MNKPSFLCLLLLLKGKRASFQRAPVLTDVLEPRMLLCIPDPWLATRGPYPLRHFVVVSSRSPHFSRGNNRGKVRVVFQSHPISCRLQLIKLWETRFQHDTFYHPCVDFAMRQSKAEPLNRNYVCRSVHLLCGETICLSSQTMRAGEKHILI